jgi:cytoskeletal protein CcmA (bactofilin family)
MKSIILNPFFMFKKITLSIFGLALMLALPMSASAAQFLGGEELTVRADQTIEENLYVGGGVANIEGEVDGDILAAGGDLTLSGSSTSDVTVVGGDVVISGNVGEDLRVAGGQVKISGTVDGDLVVAGGYIHITSSAVVEGDVMMTGGRLLVEGTLRGDLSAYGGEVELNGTVDGNIEAKSDTMIIGSSAVLGGDVNYKSKSEATISEGAQIAGVVTYEKTKYHNVPSVNVDYEPIAKILAKFLSALWLLGLISSLIIAFTLYGVAKKPMQQMVNHTFKKFWPETLRGLIIALLFPAAVLVLLFSVIGAGLGLTAIPLFMFFMMIAKVGAGILTGSLIFYLIDKKFEVNWKTILVGVVAIYIIMIIPVAGWIFYKVMFLAAFGTLWMHLYSSFKKKK